MMRPRNPLLALAAICLSGGLAEQLYASADVVGEISTFNSPNGVVERCLSITPLPGAVLSDADRREEQLLCSIDFYDGRWAICPKVFSTSPGTLVYGLAGGRYENNALQFEQEQCTSSSVAKEGGIGPVSFKMSVNGRETSATFANSSFIYYHFSRYFGTTVHVPPAVLRTIDRKVHLERVSGPGLMRSADSAALKMNHAGWELLRAADLDPDSYSPRAELLTEDDQLYGVLLEPEGRRYNAEINGTRESGWGDGQNRDFQRTAPYQALRQAGTLAQAIDAGRAAIRDDPVLAKATGTDATDAEMVFWMSDLVDITLLDFIFSQQDRVGNIDYRMAWHWVDNGQLHVAYEEQMPEAARAHQPVRLKRTELGDNDAGVRYSYANYAKRTGMLNDLRHYKAQTYRRLMELDRQFSEGGPLKDHVRDSFGLSEREFRQVTINTAMAAEILRGQCEKGGLQFDVDPVAFMRDGVVHPEAVDCSGVQ